MEIEAILYQLSKAGAPQDVLNSWMEGEMYSENYKLSIALDEYAVNMFPGKLSELTQSKEQDFISYFRSEKLFFFDNRMLNEMITHSPDTVDLTIDHVVFLDTNYASYIQEFVKSGGIVKSESHIIDKTIHTLLRNDFDFDYMFYILENYRNEMADETRTFNDAINEHGYIHDNLTQLELFKNIDRKKYFDENVLVFNITETQAKEKVNDIVSKVYQSTEGLHQLNEIIAIHNQMTLFLIGVLKIQFKSNVNAKKKLQELFEYVDETVGLYFDREMMIAHKYFKNRQDVTVFHKINKGRHQGKLLKKIQNTAWDFMAPRIMEIFIKTTSVDRYLVPFFLSRDNGLKELLSLYDVKGVLQDESNGAVLPFSSIINADYYEEEEISIPFEEFFSAESQVRRNQLYETNKKNNFDNIEKELAELKTILEDTKK